MAEPQTIARAETPEGELALRRRGDVLELIVNGVFAMDTVDVSSELALADAAGSPPGRVLVGGLGLGYTATRLVENGAEWVDIVERARPLIDWAEQDVTDQLGRLAVNTRVRLHHANITEFVPGSDQRWDAILLDVDNGPSFLIHDDNETVYSGGFLGSCLAHLYPGGQVVVWCETASPALASTLEALAGDVELLEVPVTREGRSFSYALYRVRRRRT